MLFETIRSIPHRKIVNTVKVCIGSSLGVELSLSIEMITSQHHVYVNVG